MRCGHVYVSLFIDAENRSVADVEPGRDVAEARFRLKRLCSWMRRCRLEPMKAAAKTLMGHSEKILNCFRNRLTNAICEGINSGIQAAKRKARGYKTFRTFSTMIYLIAGKLDIKSPFPLPA